MKVRLTSTLYDRTPGDYDRTTGKGTNGALEAVGHPGDVVDHDRGQALIDAGVAVETSAPARAKEVNERPAPAVNKPRRSSAAKSGPTKGAKPSGKGD